MTEPKPLDFAIIGAQKSGTTSMFKYLSKHPRIYMPPEKEIPYFSRDDLYRDGWPAFVETYFHAAPPEQLWGTASPQYMADPRVPERMYQANPECRLIALLRNPIDRAYSHYTMSLRRDMETRDFDLAVQELLAPEHLAASRDAIPPDYAEGYSQANDEVSRYYLVWSEYARALERFLQVFPQQQLLVLYMEDLKRDPAAAIAAVMEFLDLEPDFLPPNLGKVYHKGGGKQIIPTAWKEGIKGNRAFRLVWDRVPPRTRGVFNYWYDQLNVRKAKSDPGPSAETRRRLAEHFRADVWRVEQLAGKPAPWEDFK